jgi:hypothetical protein
MIQLRENALIQYHDDPQHPTVERVLYIDPTCTHLIVFDISIRKPHALPVQRTYREVIGALNGNQAHVLSHDPFEEQLTRNEADIPELYRARRDRAWTAIRPLVLNDDGSLRLEFFDPEERHTFISAAAKLYVSQQAIDDQQDAVISRTSSLSSVREAGNAPVVEHEPDEVKYAKKKVYEWVRKWWRGGMRPNALLPYWHLCGSKDGQRTVTKRLGRPSKESLRQGESVGINIDAHAQDLLIQGYKRFYNPKQQYPWKFAYLQTMALFFNDGHEIKPGGVQVPLLKPAELRPTLGQFKYYGNKALNGDYVNELKRLFGVGTFNLKHRALLGNSTQNAFGPMSVYQIDAWVADVYLVSALNRKWIIGRPVVYIVIDVFSRLIVGFSVALEGPSWAGALLALQNVVTDKVQYCTEYGITITPEMWPTAGLPRAIIADRGEFEGYDASSLENAFGVRIANTAPYRGDLKGIVERDFLMIKNLTVQFIPGYVHKLRERGTRDYRLDACLTLDEFRQVMIRHIIYHNNAWRMQWYRMDEFAIADDVPPYPIRLWNWGIENRVGALREQHAPDRVRLALLRRGTASTTPQGLLFQGLHYTIAFPNDDEGALAEELFVRARVEGRQQFTVAYDHRRINTIYLCLKEGTVLVPCHLLASETSFYGRDLDLYDVLYYWGQQESDRAAARTADEQAIVTLHAENAATIRQAQEQTRAARSEQSDTARLKGIRENRTHERDVERNREEQHDRARSDTPHHTTPTPPPVSPNAAPTSGYIPAPQPIEMLQALLEDDEREAA